MPMQSTQYGHKDRGGGAKILPWLILIVMVLFAYAVFAWMTGRIGALYGYNKALGEPLIIGGFASYSPLAVMNWPKSVWHQPAVNQITNQATLAFVLPLIFAVMLVVAFTRKPKATKDLHGTAKWATEKEIKAMGYFDGVGVYVGGWWDQKKKIQRYLRHNGPEHILCFAPTRSGKGVGLILPTLLAWEGSSVVLDIKGENYALTSGFLKSQGHVILHFDPSDAGKQSSRFNPLEEIRLGGDRGISDIQQVAAMVLDPEGKGLSDYWEKAAFGFFGGAMLHCLIKILYEQKRCANLYDVSLMLEDPDREGGPKELFKEMIMSPHEEWLAEIFPDMSPEQRQAMHIFCASAASGMLAKADKEMAGVVSTATSNLALYRDPVVAANIAASDFRIADLMNQKTPCNLYLVISPSDIARLRPLLRLFASQLLGRLTEKMEFGEGGTKAIYQHRLLLMFDEFTSLGKLPVVEQAIAYMAGYGVKGYFIVQDTKQLNAVYGQDNALMANCHVRIAFAPNLPETAEYLSKLTGTTTVVQYKKTVSKGGTSLSVQETARPLLTPDECLRLPGIRKERGSVVPGDMLIFTAGNPPVYGRQILHFLDPTFLARASMRPAPADSLYFRRERIASKPTQSVEAPTQESIESAYLRYLEDLPEGLQK
ncbi:type IV secretory system conjugative DNA transfer family protein [Desulfosarcina sp. OttesenSCG-928-A07]|nr:type IV secretory system conjugative DNA transfer family protein [Desulfosarcina sp. OttesenSCG-928-G17]MDL2328476.1 type IV secretory system conjugative DNA transfer family protein [Desulfosarcina sp. OttesenSCG-928-A07]